jgi:hypothetical protein
VPDDILARKYAQELRDGWQVRALIATRRRPIGMVVLSMLAHTYDDAMPVLLRVAFPGFSSIAPPFPTTCGRIDKTGAVVADVVGRTGKIEKNVAIFQHTADMQGQFRRLADELKLPDDQRTEMFTVAQRWIVADRRIDPTMDPRDPEARRLVLH